MGIRDSFKNMHSSRFIVLQIKDIVHLTFRNNQRTVSYTHLDVYKRQIVEFEQNGEDRAAYGEQLLKKLEQRLKTKGLNERRFREFRRLYLVYPQLKELSLIHI